MTEKVMFLSDFDYTTMYVHFSISNDEICEKSTNNLLFICKVLSNIVEIKNKEKCTKKG